MKCRVTIGGKDFEVESAGSKDGKAVYLVDGREVSLDVAARGEAFPELRAASGSARASLERLPAIPGAKAGLLRLLVNGRPVTAEVETERDRLRGLSRPKAAKKSRVTARSTLPGIIRRVLRKAGDTVAEGEPILTLEAMKMENEVRAEIAGRVAQVLVKEGQVVSSGDALAEIEGA